MQNAGHVGAGHATCHATCYMLQHWALGTAQHITSLHITASHGRTQQALHHTTKHVPIPSIPGSLLRRPDPGPEPEPEPEPGPATALAKPKPKPKPKQQQSS